MEPENDGVYDATGSGEAVGNIGADDQAMVAEETDTGAQNAEWALADTGAVGGGDQEGAGGVVFVYFIRAVEMGRIKVGITRSLEKRLLVYRTHWPDELQLLGTVRCGSREAALSMERRFLAANEEDRLHGEWLRGSAKVMEQIGRAVEVWQDWDSVGLTDEEAVEITSRYHRQILSGVLDELGVKLPYARSLIKNLFRYTLTAAMLHLQKGKQRSRVTPEVSISEPEEGVGMWVKVKR